MGERRERVKRSTVVPEVEARSMRAGKGWPRRWKAALSSVVDMLLRVEVGVGCVEGVERQVWKNRNKWWTLLSFQPKALPSLRTGRYSLSLSHIRIVSDRVDAQNILVTPSSSFLPHHHHPQIVSLHHPFAATSKRMTTIQTIHIQSVNPPRISLGFTAESLFFYHDFTDALPHIDRLHTVAKQKKRGSN